MGYQVTIQYMKSIDKWDPETGAEGRPRDVDEKTTTRSFENVKPSKADITYMVKEDFFLSFDDAHHDPEREGRFVITQVEDDNGNQDEKGRWLADYDIQISIVKTIPVKVGHFGTPSF